jgi:DNA-binding beta-propeller fold protein YncE
MFLRDGRFLLVDRLRMTAVVADRGGAIQEVLDLARMIGVKEEERPNTIIFGVNIDAEGNQLLTVPVLFKAFVISPSGQVDSFGKVGSAPGLFGIPGGIARDDEGNYFVSGRLRSVVMVFDSRHQFIREFGYRGDKPDNLIRPTDVVVGGSGRLYVSQLRNRGISVFSVTSN